MISKENIEVAHDRIKNYIYHTPVITSEQIDSLLGCSLFFKCENFQRVGAFKARGAMNALLQLSEAERQRGVATHSSGNHAQALARAAQLLQVPAYIVMPANAPQIKKKGVLSYGGIITECEPTLQAREKTLAEVVQQTGAFEIHPFNNYEVIAGQATAAKELLEDIEDLDYIIAPVGGGGLLSGTALSAKYFSAKTKVIAAEPAGADDTYRSMKSGKREISQAQSIADGLLTSLGDKTFPIIQEHVQEVITVSDEEIIMAMRLIWEKLKVIVEPSGAVPLAVVLKQPSLFINKRIGIIISGGNVDFENALSLFQKYSAI